MKITYKRLENGHALGWVAGRVRIPATSRSLPKLVMGFPFLVAWCYWHIFRKRMGWEKKHPGQWRRPWKP